MPATGDANTSVFTPDACGSTEFEMANNAALRRSHCCVLFFQVEECRAMRAAAAAGRVPSDLSALVSSRVNARGRAEKMHWPGAMRQRLPPTLRQAVVSTETARRDVHTGAVLGALASGFPVFSPDKHLQYVRDCKYRAAVGTVKCERGVDAVVGRFDAEDAKAGRAAGSRRYVVLVRDPRDIAVSWYYYRCFKTYNTQAARVEAKAAQLRMRGGHPSKRQQTERRNFEQAYSVCEPLRANPDAEWVATAASSDAVRWNASDTVMANQTVESVVGQATDFYCDFLRATERGGPHQVRVVYYEDLRERTSDELQSILDFLGYGMPNNSTTDFARNTLAAHIAQSSLPLNEQSPAMALVEALGGAAALFDKDAYAALVGETVKAASFQTVHSVETALAPADEGVGGAGARGAGGPSAASAANSNVDDALLERYKSTKYKAASFAPPSSEPHNFHTRDGSAGQWRSRFDANLRAITAELLKRRVHRDCPELMRYVDL